MNAHLAGMESALIAQVSYAQLSCLHLARLEYTDKYKYPALSEYTYEHKYSTLLDIWIQIHSSNPGGGAPQLVFRQFQAANICLY